MIILLVLLNLGISVFNSWSVGRGWTETKAVGGFAHFMSWMGAVMAVCGFTWSYTIILAFGAHELGYLSAPYVEGMTRLGYLIVVFPILGSGLAITIQSWAFFWQRRTFGNGAVAGWNTFAQVYNTVSAFRAVPESLGFLGDLLGGKGKDDKDGAMARLMIALVILAVVGGVVTAFGIIRTVARKQALDVKWGMDAFMARERMAQRKAAAR